MPTFQYKAIDSTGHKREGQLLARDKVELGRALGQMGLVLMKAISLDERESGKKYRGSISNRELIDFSHHLIMIFTSGIPLMVGLRDIRTDIANENFRKVVTDVERSVEAGQPLSEAFAGYPRIFDATYVSILRAGEESGEIEKMLTQLVEHLEWRESTKGTIVQAMIYPCILMVAVIGLIVLLLTLLLPKLAAMYAKVRVELPKPTQILIKISNFLVTDWPYLLGGIGLTIVAYIATNSTRKGKYKIDSFKLRIPFFGPLIRKSQAAQFCHTLVTLYESGVALPKALGIVAAVLKNSVLADAVRKTITAVEEGKPMSESFKASNVFQPLVVRMVAAGEQTGELGSALGRVNKFYDREVPAAVKKFVAAMEPAIIVVAGVSVGFILLCTLLPIFRLISAIKK
ncbi:MAG: type II secretion system F family protein [Planctomycetota bacterium]